MSRWWLGIVAAFAFVEASAQDVQPRTFSPAPVGTNVVGLAYSYSTGAVLFDKTIPIEEATGDINAVSLVYSRSIGVFGMSGRLDAVLPVAAGSWEGQLAEEEQSVERTGLGDPTIRVSLFFLGAPALSPEQFAAYRSGNRTVLAGMIRFGIPLGQYDPERLVNIGSNRWTVSPQLGFSHITGRMLVEAYASTWLFTTNSSFLGTKSQTQDPVFAFQLHIGYRFKRGLWLAMSSRQSIGGAVSIDGGDRLDPETNNRIGVTLGIPLGHRYSLRAAMTTPLVTRVGNDYDTFGLALQTIF